MVHDAEDEQARRIVLEVRRLYAEEDARAKTEGAVYSLLSSAHQQLHGAARTLEGALRIIAPPQEAPQTAQTEPQRKRPTRFMMDEQPTSE